MDSKEVLAENSKLFGEHLPDVAKNFTGMCGEIFKDGKLSLKEKELIALAIGITVNATDVSFITLRDVLMLVVQSKKSQKWWKFALLWVVALLQFTLENLWELLKNY